MISPQEGKFLIESNAIEGEHSNDALQDAVVAWEYLRMLSKLVPNDVRIAHKLMMIRLRPDIAGKWRNCDVFIGGLRKDNLGPLVFENKVREITDQVDHHVSKRAKKAYKEQRCIDLHVKFEELHPFEDGNGRVGRMVYNWHRLSLGLDLDVILAAERGAYYRWFRKGDGKF